MQVDAVALVSPFDQRPAGTLVCSRGVALKLHAARTTLSRRSELEGSSARVARPLGSADKPVLFPRTHRHLYSHRVGSPRTHRSRSHSAATWHAGRFMFGRGPSAGCSADARTPLAQHCYRCGTTGSAAEAATTPFPANTVSGSGQSFGTRLTDSIGRQTAMGDHGLSAASPTVLPHSTCCLQSSCHNSDDPIVDAYRRIALGRLWVIRDKHHEL